MNPDLDDISLLAGAAKRLRSNPDYMAHLLSEFQERASIDDEGLARSLGTLPEMVVRLALCKRPVRESAGFADQVRDLSDYTLIEEDVLHRLIGSQKPEAVAQRAHFPPDWFRDLFARHRLSLALALPLATLASIGVLWWGATKLQSGPEDGTQVTATQPVLPEPGRPADKPVTDDSQVSKKDEPAPTPGSTPEPEERKGARSLLPAVSLVRIDLDDYAILRGDTGAGTHQELIAVPASPTRLSLRLPRGSSRGAYVVRLVGPFGESLIEAATQSSTGRTIEVKMDFSAVARNRYRLCVQLGSEPPDCYPIAIK